MKNLLNLQHNNRLKHAQPSPLGLIEPHAPMLTVSPCEQLLYKVMTIEDLIRSFGNSYLHFNRVDSYSDFPGADPHDGQQLPLDQPGNEKAVFTKAPDFSAADYFNQSRARTYACCFSLDNSDSIWSNYAKNSKKGKACLVFNFGKLRTMINDTLQSGNAGVLYQGLQCNQIFSVNYGIVEYVDWSQFRTNTVTLPNPIKYTYLKDKSFMEEKELRVSLSALGIGQFVLTDNSTIQFPPTLRFEFNFKAAIADGTITQILHAPNSDSALLLTELGKLGIEPRQGG